MRNIDVIANDLAQARYDGSIIAGELKAIKDDEEKFRIELLEALKGARLKTVKSEDGTVFARSERVNYSVVDKVKALVWAKKNKCVTVDKAAANKILRTKYPNMPSGFEVSVTEFISVRGNNDTETSD